MTEVKIDRELNIFEQTLEDYKEFTVTMSKTTSVFTAVYIATLMGFSGNIFASNEKSLKALKIIILDQSYVLIWNLTLSIVIIYLLEIYVLGKTISNSVNALSRAIHSICLVGLFFVNVMNIISLFSFYRSALDYVIRLPN